MTPLQSLILPRRAALRRRLFQRRRHLRISVAGAFKFQAVRVVAQRSSVAEASSWLAANAWFHSAKCRLLATMVAACSRRTSPAARLAEQRAVMLPAPALKAPPGLVHRVAVPTESLQNPLAVYDALPEVTP